MMEYKFSLILCTLGRKEDVRVALESFSKQEYNHFECIIVDQNVEDILTPIVDQFKDKICIKHIRSKVKGLSANRNIGIKSSTGDIIAFPDDDCQYLPDTLKNVNNYLNLHNDIDVLTINIKDPFKEKYFIGEKGIKILNRYNYRPYGISIGVFIKYKNKTDVKFDDQLGAGSRFGADEESDLVSSLIEKKYKICYCGGMYVLHLTDLPNLSEEQIIRRFKTYGLGYGALMKKEIVYRRKYRLVFMCCKDTFGRLIAGLIPVKKRKLYLVSALARIQGFIQYKLINE